MASVDRLILAPPAQVFAVLADGWTYSNWVVGSSHVRAVSANWPDAGSKLHHASGAWPLDIRDESVVDAVEPDVRLELTVKGRPLGEAKVVITLRPDGDGTRVTLDENPVKGPGKWLDNPALELVLAKRNVEALGRLAAIAERHTSPPLNPDARNDLVSPFVQVQVTDGMVSALNDELVVESLRDDVVLMSIGTDLGFEMGAEHADIAGPSDDDVARPQLRITKAEHRHALGQAEVTIRHLARLLIGGEPAAARHRQRGSVSRE